MPSKWIEHTKAYAKEKGMKYKEALKCAECKASYKTGSGPPRTPLPDNTKFHMAIAQPTGPEQPTAQPVVEGSGMKKTSPWIEHVKSYAKAKGLKYFDALKDPECKAKYKTGGGVGQPFIKGMPAPKKTDSQMKMGGALTQLQTLAVGAVASFLGMTAATCLVQYTITQIMIIYNRLRNGNAVAPGYDNLVLGDMEAPPIHADAERPQLAEIHQPNLRRVYPEPDGPPVVATEVVRAPISPVLVRNGNGLKHKGKGMTRYGMPGTFTREDARRIDQEDRDRKEMRNKPTVNSVTY
jgi:hypothetical protein